MDKCRINYKQLCKYKTDTSIAQEQEQSPQKAASSGMVWWHLASVKNSKY